MICFSFQASAISATETPAAHFEPQVAILCEPSSGSGKGQIYHSQYMSEQGKWTTDVNSKATCLKDKMDILDYCKKVYPKRDVTNIVEGSHYLKIPNWCKVGHKKCKTSRWVKPFRCLEGPFQSDALLVPENCLFDHIHNQTKCWEFSKWNLTASQSCQDRDMQLRSFAMLLPCGISLFSGVEFVCCPKHFKENMKPKKPIEVIPLPTKEEDQLEATEDADDASPDDDDDDDDDDDTEDEEMAADEPDDAEEMQGDDPAEEDDDDDDEDYDDSSDGSTTAKPKQAFGSSTTSSYHRTSAPTKVVAPTPDPYFTHFDPRVEHQAYKEAQQRLEELHREKVTKVMKDWSDLEERYQDMRTSDPKAAEEFKKRMTQRFQRTVQSLEEEGNAEKHQLVAMHQQRVMAHINQRKKEAMSCYTQALNDNPPNTHRVQKCLQKLLRSLHKDRHHAIAHYKHLLSSSFEQAEREKGLTLEHLTDIDRMVNQSLQMLQRYPDLLSKIGQLMDDYIQALRSKDETPGSLLTMTKEAEAAILDKYRADVTAKQEEKERQRILEKQRKEARKKERMELREEKHRVESTIGQKIDKFDPETMEDEKIEKESNSVTTTKTPTILTAVHETPRVAHAQSHDLSHSEPSYSVRREVYHRENRSVYFTLSFAGIALMAALVVGVAVLRRRHARHPRNQGFVEVDDAMPTPQQRHVGFVEIDEALPTPEQRHVANMQINGYENPTYKYFENKE
ncbi:UNVERIFIED_CONTAM: hypothetical protein PYX00_001847 [Menopon gallinae]|uniref:Beta-amyloid-like protein n=1 Tax=Menopon gallinae TaxID=328185 RepID=A0AAW2IFU5_9NEOP